MSFQLSIDTHSDAFRRFMNKGQGSVELIQMLNSARVSLADGVDHDTLRTSDGTPVGSFTATHAYVNTSLSDALSLDEALLQTRTLTERITELDAAVSAAYTARDDAKMDLQRERAALESWKVDLGRGAMALAKEHGWCEVVKEFLDENDIPTPAEKYTFTANVRVRFVATWAGSGEPDRSDVRYAIEGAHYTDDKVQVWVSGEWDNPEIDEVEVSDIDDVTAYKD